MKLVQPHSSINCSLVSIKFAYIYHLRFKAHKMQWQISYYLALTIILFWFNWTKWLWNAATKFYYRNLISKRQNNPSFCFPLVGSLFPSLAAFLLPLTLPYFLVVLRTKPIASHMQSKCSPTELKVFFISLLLRCSPPVPDQQKMNSVYMSDH